MTRLLFYFVLIFPLSLIAQKEPKNNVFSNVDDAGKMIRAKQKMYGGEYVSALNIYREVEKNNPKNATVQYYLAYCHFQLNQTDAAKTCLLKALDINSEIKPETYLLLGKVYQIEEDYDKAIENLNTFSKLFQTNSIATEDKEDGALHHAQCSLAKVLIAKPYEVTIKNLGAGLNSKYDDKNPCITADGKQLVFTTRRPETTNSEKDIEGDGGYYEDIYLSQLDSLSKEFKLSSPAGGAINSKAHDACTSISPDGKQIFIYKNDASKSESRGGNIFVSKIAKGKWKVPETLGKPINSSYWEGGACVSSDGRWYFFSSEREGGYGKSDIWMVEKLNKTQWAKPINLGPQVNSMYDEAGMFFAPDGKTLFYCSNGPMSMGGYDILKTVFENGKWTDPVNIGFPINSSAKEGQLTLSADAKFAYFSSNRKGGYGESDLYIVDLKDYAILEKEGVKAKPSGLSILKGTIREGFEGYGLADVEVSVSNLDSKIIISTFTNESGEYFLTLGGGNYQLDLRKKGYQPIQEKFELPTQSNETVILEKGFLLKK